MNVKRNYIFIILGISVLLRLIGLNQSLWLDEAIQATVSLKPLLAVNYGVDFQPPLFYVLTHFWVLFGIHTEWFLRLLSVFFGVTTVYVLYVFMKKLCDENSALVASLLLAIAPYHIYFSQEFRMYSLLGLLILLSWLFLYEKKWLLYSVVIMLSVFTHYFAIIAIISQFFFLILVERKSIRNFFASLIPTSILFYFWLPTFLKQLYVAHTLVSIWPRWKEVSSVSFLKFPFLFLAKTTVGMITLENKILYGSVVIIAGIIFLCACVNILTHKLNAKRYTLLFCYFLLPLIIAWVSGLLLAANSPHRLTFILPAFYAIIAVGLSPVIASEAKQSQKKTIEIATSLILFAPRNDRALFIIFFKYLFFIPLPFQLQKSSRKLARCSGLF